jgi:hypothetical protein
MDILSDRNFLELKDKFNTTNIFEILKIESSENRNSDFLAWLLNTKATHGCGELFARKLLPVLFPQIDFENYYYQIKREVHLGFDGRVDLTLESNSELLVLENKIFTTDHGDQLSKYRGYFEKKYKDHKIGFCYLTLTGKDAIEANENDYWARCGHEKILKLLEEISEDWEKSPARSIILNYIQNMKRNLLCIGEEHNIAKNILNERPELGSEEIIELMKRTEDDAAIMALRFLESSIPKVYIRGTGFFSIDDIFRSAFVGYFSDHKIPVHKSSPQQTTYFVLNFICTGDGRLMPVTMSFRLQANSLTLIAAVQPEKKGNNLVWNDDRSYILEKLDCIKSNEELKRNSVPPQGVNHVTFWRKNYPFIPADFRRSHVEEALYDWMESNEIVATYKELDKSLNLLLNAKQF